MPSREASTSGSRSRYVELATRTFGITVEAYASANERALNFTKAFWEIAMRPYSSPAIDSASELVSPTISALGSSGRKAAEFAEQFAEQTAQLAESYATSLRGLADVGVSNLAFARDTANRAFEDVTTRMDETATNFAAPFGTN